MSEKILRALMQLFAIIAKVEFEPENFGDSDIDSESISKVNYKEDSMVVESFLKSELNSLHVDKYLNLFENYIQIHHGIKNKKDGLRKRTSVNSVKVLRICAQINQELTQKQKFIVLVRLFEFINSTERVSEDELIFVNTVAEMFNISEQELNLLKIFLHNDVKETIDNSDILYISNTNYDLKHSKKINLEGLDSDIKVLNIQSINTLFYRYFGDDELLMNGQIVRNRVHILNQGSTIKTSKSKPLYYSDIHSNFLLDSLSEKITFKAENLEYSFKKSKNGLKGINFIEESGKLIGLMGGSGTGKSTFLNILNGNITPTNGNVKINGFDVHKEKAKLEGVIGFISQDDLLIEELTVYQNLYYNTKLCFKDLSDLSIKKKVLTVLSAVGLTEVKHLVVGNPLDQKISGGQRKRLNIALELIREPSVLFVDEPTSGLSSRDSENIIDLLKELSFKGKLIFVVIHQPSSEIFKMFDRLFILDKGGYPIFDGDPIDAVVYFKKHINHVNAEERECYTCGNVNPEQIFNIIESKVVDEYGNLTTERKTSPSEWNELYLKNVEESKIIEKHTDISTSSKIPKKFRQFKVFFSRDLMSKITNKQYVFINLIEAPLLALVLSFFIKFYNSTSKYTFFENVNIPQYIFISVIVALFLGLTVSAEEIFKDKKILKREIFLNLSRRSYLFSKISILFILSAIQTMLFVLVGNVILEIKGMWFEYWLVLFSTSCLANVLGLNISSAFNSVKVIYIIVPIIIIPQLLFSGVIVSFDKLNPFISKTTEVPWLGNNMAVRWAYEALAVAQSKNNKFEAGFYDLNQERAEANWKKDYWMEEMNNHLSNISDPKTQLNQFNQSREILINELGKEELKWSNLKCENCLNSLSQIDKGTVKPNVLEKVKDFLSIVNDQYIKISNDKTHEIDILIAKMGEKKYNELKNNYDNESLSDLVTNRKDLEKIIIEDNQLKQKENPIYNEPKKERFLDAHFYSPNKYIFNIKLPTIVGNIIVLWIMSAFFFLTLYYDLLKKALSFSKYFLKK